MMTCLWHDLWSYNLKEGCSMPPTAESVRMLHDARRKASTLLADLIRQRTELEEFPPKIPPEDLDKGMQAVVDAIVATRRMVQSLDEALKLAQNPPN
jgi:predicted FMN-binding regulatory protein PaiB